MGIRYFVLVAGLLAVGTLDAGAQVDRDSAPEQSYLLQITHRWGRESALGDLRYGVMGDDDVELRVWGGYGLGGTSGVVVRREKGRWRAWFANVARCVVWIPSRIADTASTGTVAGYTALAKSRCGAEPKLPELPATGFSVDTLAITEIGTPTVIERAWSEAVQNGVLTLPEDWPPGVILLDGFTRVIELRQGQRYRTSTVREIRRDTSDVARRVRSIDAALDGLLRDRR